MCAWSSLSFVRRDRGVVRGRRNQVLVGSASFVLAFVTGCSTSAKNPASSGPSRTGGSVSTSASATTDISALSADEVLEKATKTLFLGKPLQLKGTVVRDGHLIGVTTLIGGTSSGSGFPSGDPADEDAASGSISIGDAVLQFRVSKANKFYKYNASLLRVWKTKLPAETISNAGKWLHFGSVASSFEGMVLPYASLLGVGAMWLGPSGADGILRLGDPATIRGIECLSLKYGSADLSNTLYVAKSDGRPVEWDTVGTTRGRLTISFDDEQPARPPSAGEVIEAFPNHQ